MSDQIKQINPTDFHLLNVLEKEYPAGSDLTIMNTYYQYPKFDPETHKKVSDDFIVIVYRDNKLGVTKHKVVYHPDYIYYKLNDDIPQTEYPRLFIEKEKVHPISVPFTELEASIAKETGNEDFYKSNLFNKNRAENKKLHLCSNIFFSDSNIESHYRFRFDQLYTNESPAFLTKGFLDIEIDNKYSCAELGDPSDSPINCVSFFDTYNNKLYTFLLRMKQNPLINDLETKIKNKLFGFKEIHNFIIDAVGGEEKAKFYNIDTTLFDIRFYDNEVDLLIDLFATIHKSDLDLVGTWNGSAFDLDFIIKRIYYLGYLPEDIMCDQSWEIKVVTNVIDTRNINQPAERGDYTFISGNTIFIDDMIQYASRRKSKIGSYKSLKLDAIGELEAGVRKLDYSHITHNISDLPYLDYTIFVLYNMMDVIVLHCIEKIANDFDYIVSKCIINNTPYNKGHRQTAYLINRMAKDWYNKGYIIGNNANKFSTKPEKFPGALVHDPLKTNDYIKQRIAGRPIMIIDNMQDYDFKALYPSITGESNIAANTQIGKIEIPNKIYKNENAYNTEGYTRSGEFIENKVTDNVIEFCHRWFHLGGVMDLITEIDNKVSKNGIKYNTVHPIRISKRDRYKHPIRIIKQSRPTDEDIVNYNNKFRKVDYLV